MIEKLIRDFKKPMNEARSDAEMDAEEKKAYAEMVKFFEQLQKDLPKALQEVKSGKMGYDYQNLVGKLIRTSDEKWYQYFHR